MNCLNKYGKKIIVTNKISNNHIGINLFRHLRILLLIAETLMTYKESVTFKDWSIILI